VDHVGRGSLIVASEKTQSPNRLHTFGSDGRGMGPESQGVIDGHAQILKLFRRVYDAVADCKVDRLLLRLWRSGATQLVRQLLQGGKDSRSSGLPGAIKSRSDSARCICSLVRACRMLMTVLALVAATTMQTSST
jgi:hypothetical protein